MSEFFDVAAREGGDDEEEDEEVREGVYKNVALTCEALARDRGARNHSPGSCGCLVAAMRP